MKRRLNLSLLLVCVGVGCRPAVDPPSPPSPPPSGNRPPVAVAGGPYSTDNGTVQFDGSASSDPDGDPLSYQWQFGDGATSTERKPSHTYSGDGTYNVSLVVRDDSGLSSGPSATTASVTSPASSGVLVGAGNIASNGNNDERTAQLIEAIPNATVFTLGDNVAGDGTLEEYQSTYDPTWGRFLSRTRPTLGNHEYEDENANGSFEYFGERLGPARGLGYYSYDVGQWHVIVLNDHGRSGGVDEGQIRWLVDDLTANSGKRCTIAMWHVPLFISSNTPGSTRNSGQKAVWDVLYAANVDVVLNAQQHNYERFAPMRPDGSVDQANGIRQFNVGTGGESTAEFQFIHPNSEVHSNAFGVLKLTLRADRYDWQFMPIPGSTFSDSGSGSCH